MYVYMLQVGLAVRAAGDLWRTCITVACASSISHSCDISTEGHISDIATPDSSTATADHTTAAATTATGTATGAIDTETHKVSY
jgi:hypothetical protein